MGARRPSVPDCSRRDVAATAADRMNGGHGARDQAGILRGDHHHQPVRGRLDAAPSFNPDAVLRDYRIAVRSRQISLLGRAEVLTGKAKFGIFGDGKEVAQLAMARAFRQGDFRSGYYRDQTFMLALGAMTVASSSPSSTPTPTSRPSRPSAAAR